LAVSPTSTSLACDSDDEGFVATVRIVRPVLSREREIIAPPQPRQKNPPFLE